jgi:hypothetical protein
MKNIEIADFLVDEEKGVQFYKDILSKQDDPGKFYFELLHILSKLEKSQKKGRESILVKFAVLPLFPFYYI